MSLAIVVCGVAGNFACSLACSFACSFTCSFHLWCLCYCYGTHGVFYCIRLLHLSSQFEAMVVCCSVACTYACGVACSYSTRGVRCRYDTCVVCVIDTALRSAPLVYGVTGGFALGVVIAFGAAYGFAFLCFTFGYLRSCLCSCLRSRLWYCLRYCLFRIL